MDPTLEHVILSQLPKGEDMEGAATCGFLDGDEMFQFFELGSNGW